VQLNSTGAWFTPNYPKVEPSYPIKVEGDDKIKQTVD